MARTPEAETAREHAVRIRVTSAERDEIQRRAVVATGGSVSGYIRHLITRDLESAGRGRKTAK